MPKKADATVAQQQAAERIPLGGPWHYPDTLVSSRLVVWWQDMAKWVGWLVETYSYLWPGDAAVMATRAHGAAQPRDPGWPSCWYEHRGFVDDLVALRAWHRGLIEEAEWAGGVHGWADWHLLLRGAIAEGALTIAQVCQTNHTLLSPTAARDVQWSLAAAVAKASGQPPPPRSQNGRVLPWRPAPTPPQPVAAGPPGAAPQG